MADHQPLGAISSTVSRGMALFVANSVQGRTFPAHRYAGWTMPVEADLPVPEMMPLEHHAAPAKEVMSGASQPPKPMFVSDERRSPLTVLIGVMLAAGMGALLWNMFSARGTF